MKYIKKIPSEVDKEFPYFVFSFGIKETRLLLDILDDFVAKCPKVFETSQVRQRAKGMIKILKKTIREYKNEN